MVWIVMFIAGLILLVASYSGEPKDEVITLPYKDPFAEARKLHAAVNAMGDIRHKTKQEVISLLGMPKNISNTLNGSTLDWFENGYSISIAFTPAGRVLMIVNEYCNYL